MLSKTAVKKKDSSSDKIKGFIVTESGELVEDSGSLARKVKEHKSLLDSVSDSIKESNRRASVMPPGEQHQPGPAKAERSGSLKIANVAAAKTQFGNLLSKRRSSSR